jgi:hypothetical protein
MPARRSSSSTEAEGHPRGSTELEIVAVRPSGRGHPAFVALVLLAALTIAIAKPWDGSTLPATSGEASAARASDGPSEPATTVPSRVTSGRLDRGPSIRAVRLSDWARLASDPDDLEGQPIVTDRDLGGTDGDGTCGGTATITPWDQLIAIAAGPGIRLAAIRLFAIDSIRRPEIVTKILDDRPGPLDRRSLGGLVLVELPSGGVASSQYALIADLVGPAGPARRVYTVCVG